jgi:hypothetical protein
VAIAVKQTPTQPRLALASTQWIRPNFARPVLAFGILFALLADVRFRAFHSDTYMTLAAGREVAHHGLPGFERLTLGAAGHHWVDQQWLAQWLLFHAWQAGGDAGAALLAAALTAGGFALLTALLLSRGTTPGRALEWSVLAFAVALPDTGVRAQAFAYPLFVALVWLLLRDLERPGSPIGLLPAIALLVVWANLHGSVLLGAALAAAYCAWQAVRRFGAERRASVLYAAVGAAALASPFATPYGLDTLSYYRAVLANPAIRSFSSEWQPARPTTVAALGFFVLVAMLALVLWRSLHGGVRPDPVLLTATVALCIAGFYALRWEAWAAIVGVVFGSDLLVQRKASPRTRPARVRAALVLGLIFVLGSSVALSTQPESRFDSQGPVGAMRAAATYAAAHPRTAILTDDSSADALLWAHPELAGRVGFDDRLEIYSRPAVRRWADFIRGNRGLLPSGYGIVVAGAANRRLVRRVRVLSDWRVIYDRPDGTVAVRGRSDA